MNGNNEMNVKEIRQIREWAFRRIQNDQVEWKKWNDAKEQVERELMLTEHLIKIVAEECLSVAFSNDAWAVANMRDKFGVEK